MSTARTPRSPTLADPYFYGFRSVERVLPDGEVEYEDVPLTEEDVIHPQEGDYITANEPHDIDRTYLRTVLTDVTVQTPGAAVISDCLVHWRVGRIRPMGPDLAVIHGVRERRAWTMFDVAVEGVAPELVLEITSPSTRNADLGRKVDRYYRVGVPFYVIVDREWGRDGVRRVSLLGYRRGRRGFVRMRLNRQRRLWLQTVGCWLGIEQGQAVCYDARGARIGDYTDQRQGREAAEERAATAEERAATAEERAQAEAQAREAAEERAAAAEEQIRQLKEELLRRGSF